MMKKKNPNLTQNQIKKILNNMKLVKMIVYDRVAAAVNERKLVRRCYYGDINDALLAQSVCRKTEPQNDAILVWIPEPDNHIVGSRVIRYSREPFQVAWDFFHNPGNGDN